MSYSKLLWFIAFPFCLLAQNESDSLILPKADKWSIGYSLVFKNTHLQAMDDLFDETPLTGRKSFSYGIYADVLFAINDRVTIQSGFSFQRIPLRFRGEQFITLCYGDLQGNTLIERYSFIGYETDLWHFGIPIGAKVKIAGSKGNTLYSRLSAEFLHNIKGTDSKALYECGVETSIGHQSIEHASVKNNLQLQLSVGFGFSHWEQQFFLEPMVNYSLLPTQVIYSSDQRNLDTTFDVRYLQIGVGFGIRY